MAKFFSAFPKAMYNGRLITDILVRIKAKESWLADPSVYYNYIYKDTDRPEHIAQKYYGDEELHWIILITNNIFNPFFDFPISSLYFDSYINDKYKEAGINSNLFPGEDLNFVGLYYAQQTPDPVFRYQKHIRIINSEKVTEEYYAIDKKTYENLVYTERYSSVKTYYVNLNTTRDSSVVYVEGGVTDSLSEGDILNQNSTFPEFTSIIEILDSTSFKISSPALLTTFNIRTVIYNPGVDGSIYEISRRTPEVTIYERELELNENKRVIKILNKSYIEQAKKELISLLR